MARQFQQQGLLGFLAAKDAGQPLMLAIDSIEEDPAQPRREFDAEALRELADTIALRGVRQPISVRPHPERPKRWILNFGSRRLRASKLAGRKEIPAFVDTTSDSFDQVIENEQRESLRPLELALFVQRRIAAGDSQTEIARRLGKSRQYVTYATALIDAPDWLLAAYREGKCKGLTELYELRRLHGEHAERVEAWASGREAMTRESIAALRSNLMVVEPPSELAPSQSLPVADTSGELPSLEILEMSQEQTPTVLVGPNDLPSVKPGPPRKAARLAVELGGRPFELVVDKDPGRQGEVFVRPLEGGAQTTVSATDVRLVGFVAG
jgi:ParB family chromosome partitioning protein